MAHRVLVTGGAGFIGGWLTRALLARGTQVCVLDDLSTGSIENVPKSSDLDFHRGSVCDADAVERAAAGCHLIIHMAGLTGMRLAHSLKREAYTIASTGTATLLDNSGADTPVVLVSSSAVYGLTSRGPVSESTPITEASVCSYDGGEVGYAAGKWRLEELGREAAAAGRQVLILRPFNVIGPGQSPRYGMVLPSFVKLALRDEALCVYDHGEQTRSFCDVRTFCDVLLRLSTAQQAWAVPARTVNIGSPNQISIRRLAEMVIEEAGAESEITYQPYSQVFPGRTDVAHRAPNTQLLETLLGQPEWLDVRAIVRQTLASKRQPESRWSAHRSS
jgi:UDP-glucose 4-epimerase